MKNRTKTMGYLVLIVSFLVVLMYCIGYRLGTCDPHYSWDRQPYLLDGIFFPVLVIFYLLFTHKVKNNKILIVIAVMEMIVVAVLYIAYHTNKLYYEHTGTSTLKPCIPIRWHAVWHRRSILTFGIT